MIFFCCLIRRSKFNISQFFIYIFLNKLHFIFDGLNHCRWFSRLVFHVALTSIKLRICEKYKQNICKNLMQKILFGLLFICCTWYFTCIGEFYWIKANHVKNASKNPFFLVNSEFGKHYKGSSRMLGKKLNQMIKS